MPNKEAKKGRGSQGKTKSDDSLLSILRNKMLYCKVGAGVFGSNQIVICNCHG